MLRRAWLFLVFVVSSFFINQYASASEINATNYNIYIGDVNGDGYKDFFFKGKPFVLILHGTIATPITINWINVDFVVYLRGNTYDSPVGVTISSATLTANIANGSFKLAQVGVDYVTWSDAGQSNILLKHSNSTVPPIMLTSNGGTPIPLATITASSGCVGGSSGAVSQTYQYDGLGRLVKVGVLCR